MTLAAALGEIFDNCTALGLRSRTWQTKPRRSGPIAQLDRVLDYESRGRGFESSSVRHYPIVERHTNLTNISQLDLGKVNVWPLKMAQAKHIPAVELYVADPQIGSRNPSVQG